MATRKSSKRSAGKSAKGSSGKSAERQLADLQREAQRFREATSNLSNAAVELWGARTESALAPGDKESAERAVVRPERPDRPGGPRRPSTDTGFYDSNTNCGCGGTDTGTAGW
jgi:hypothetical protein